VWHFVVDEDMPRSTAPELRRIGHTADDVRDIGLRGHADAEVFAEAQKRRAILVTADKGFANVLDFPLGSHAGLIVVRVPNELPTRQLDEELLRALEELSGENLHGLLVIVEVGRTRIRRPPTSPRSARPG
jgi:predicted nuclease of predicted toxin-antitoxin system